MINWHSLTPIQIASELSSDIEAGLTTSQAKGRLVQTGSNKLSTPSANSPWGIFFDQLKSVMTILLLAAAVIAFVLGDHLEGISILIVLLLNAVLGFVNEYRAERSVQALKALTVPLAKVVRDGVNREIFTEELVPGDIILFEAGDRIPADARLIETWSMRVNEAALTGESLPTDKNAHDVLHGDVSLAERTTMVYTGTAVTQGRGKAIVTATGATTEIGKISMLLTGVEDEQTPLQQRLDRLGRILAFVAVSIATVMVLIGVLRGETFLVMLESSLALAIAAVPEGLAAVATIALALGMRRMAKRNAIVRRLSAVETLGSTNVICTDKTGTLTQNQMTVREMQFAGRIILVDGAGYEPKGEFSEHNQPINPQEDHHLTQILRAGLLCNTATLRHEDDQWTIIGDPTEGSLVVAANKLGLNTDYERDTHPPVKEIPFDTSNRRMATFHKNSAEDGGGFIVFAKGAPESILPGCTDEQRGNVQVKLTEPYREQLWKINDEMGGRALRVLALAYKKTQREDDEPFDNLTLLGLVGMMDPPRPEAKVAIQSCQQAGIRVVMITGDQKATARAIAHEIGILGTDGQQEVIDGRSLDLVDDGELHAIVAETSVYARVSPEQKLRIVTALQTNGQIVAMTGDGVNDAPALKTADIGVAMGKIGTDVAREAADMVLVDDNFATIVAAIEEGRTVFANVKKFVYYLFSCNLSEILTMFVATIAGWPMPLFPLQILWLNLITDVFPALALAGEPAESGVMLRPPPTEARAKYPPASFIRQIISHGVLLAAVTLAAFAWSLNSSGELPRATTVAFLTLGLSQLFHVLNSRYESGSTLRQGMFTNRAIWVAILLTIVLQLAAVYLPVLQTVLKTVPPTLTDWMVVIVASLIPTITIELYKISALKTTKTGLA